MKFAFIQAHANEHAIRTLCRVLAVSKAGYYAWCRRAPSARATATRTLTIAIDVAFRASTARYGSPRVHRELRAHGQYHSRKRVAQIMQGEGWRAVAPKRYRVTTDSRHTTAVAPNQLARVFAPTQQAGTNRVWVGDVTYVATRAGWLYLAVLLDLASRRVVGWAMRDSLDGALTRDALAMAIAQRRPAPGLIHHSDRGGQYAATDYRAMLAAHGMSPSMSRKGNCWDNAVAESFFATIKRELLDRTIWHTHGDARSAIFNYIEMWYNRSRRHSSLDYRSPDEYERWLAEAA
jgi:putative transposase